MLFGDGGGIENHIVKLRVVGRLGGVVEGDVVCIFILDNGAPVSVENLAALSLYGNVAFIGFRGSGHGVIILPRYLKVEQSSDKDEHQDKVKRSRGDNTRKMVFFHCKVFYCNTDFFFWLIKFWVVLTSSERKVERTSPFRINYISLR